VFVFRTTGFVRPPPKGSQQGQIKKKPHPIEN
jgi:hypothetical protein